MQQTEEFAAAWDQCLQQTSPWQDEIESYREDFWRWLGKPEPESNLYMRRLEQMPFFWALQKTGNGDERNLDRLWHKQRDNQMFWLDLIAWRQIQPVFFQLGKEYPDILVGKDPAKNHCTFHVADWQPGAGALGRWVAAFVVVWQGLLWLAPGYEMLSPQNGKALRQFARQRGLSCDADTLTPAAFRLTAALPRYPAATLEDILNKTAIFAPLENCAQTN